MNPEDERFLGLIMILYPLAFGIAGLLAYEIIRRTIRVCWRNRREWMA